eukprot:COSAG05_NODE_1052_length_6028_cov_149.430553_1_plen_80_part_00
MLSPSLSSCDAMHRARMVLEEISRPIKEIMERDSSHTTPIRDFLPFWSNLGSIAWRRRSILGSLLTETAKRASLSTRDP